MLEQASGLRGPAGVLLAVVIAIVAAVLATAQRLLRPLGPLASAVQRLREGELGARVEEAGTGRGRRPRSRVQRDGRVPRGAATRARGGRTQRPDERGAAAARGRGRPGLRHRAARRPRRRADLERRRATRHRVRRERHRRPADHVARGPQRPDRGPARRGDPVRDVASPRAGTCGPTAAALPRPAHGHHAAAGRSAPPTATRPSSRTSPTGSAAQEALEEALRREQEAASELRSANEVKDEFLAVAAHEIRTPALGDPRGEPAARPVAPGCSTRPRPRRSQQLIWRHASDMRDIVERSARLHPAPGRSGPPHARGRCDAAYRVRTRRDQPGRLLTDHRVVTQAPDVDRRGRPGPAAARAEQPALERGQVQPRRDHGPADGARRRRLAVGRVEDEGSGIDPDDHERVFELFRQADHDSATARGTGVGLAIVRRYVELAGGSVRVDSRRGEGARFTVTLPARVSPGTGPEEFGQGSRR